ncbi:aryl-alcohol oxidase-like protein [Crucibulum laeve]|uniref:pyranose dehydrogenase (acceptor) n=1 Tax=Crucibulum laeve TaxID=68775 RepID=A0A5C3LIG2_9AGAR|nr:aryl-alcohol oxidase-like protein [Crucibulum laeve]
MTSGNKYITSAADVAESSYDFIIVGGGTAGCVLANRLTESPDVKVLMIEAGGSAEGNMRTEAPFMAVTLAGSEFDWSFKSVPQSALNSRVIDYSRGKTLGGSSATNLMTWNRAADELWDRWARITQDDGWSWKNISKYHQRSCTFVPSADGHDTTGQAIPSAYGNGPIKVSVAGFPTELDEMVINASKELGGRFPHTEDLNVGSSLGIGYMPSSIGDSLRSSAATAYLAPIKNRGNLDILINTHVTKVVQSGTEAGVPAFRTVEVTAGPSEPRHRISATKEVIICGGVFATPQLLLLSGIGPKQELEQHGIDVVVDLPDVGAKFVDHPLLANYYEVNSENTFDGLLRDPSAFGANIEKWMTTKQGLLVNSPANTQGYIRLPEDSDLLKKFSDPASGPQSGHIEFIFIDGFAQFGPTPPPATGNYMTVLTGVLTPLASGKVSLNSSDPFAKPKIDPALLTSEFDLGVMIQSIKDVQTFLKAGPWKGFVKGPWGDLAAATTDEGKVEYIRQYASMFNHPCGGAVMSPAHSSDGVLDPQLLVKKTAGLRVVDSSIFPLIPECHIQALVYVVAERAADLIKEKHLGSDSSKNVV